MYQLLGGLRKFTCDETRGLTGQLMQQQWGDDCYRLPYEVKELIVKHLE